MNLPLANPESLARLKRIVADLPGVSLRAMFGQTAMFVAGQMAGGTWGATLNVRLSPEDRVAADAAGCSLFDPMGGRPMSEYRVLPVEMPEAEMAEWIRRSVAWTAALPPKPEKAAKAPRRPGAGPRR